MPKRGHPLDNTSDSEKQRERGRKGARKKGQLSTPQWRQNQVLALHLAGKAYRQISKELHMNTDTITRILSQPEVRELKEQYRQRVLDQVPIVLERIKGKLRSSKVDWRLLVDLLRGTQILVNKVEEEVTQHDGFENRSTADLKFYVEHGCWPEESAGPTDAGPQSPGPKGGPGPLIQ
jgi:hypothetical protein